MNNSLHIQNEHGFDVIGIALRTSNKAAIEEGTIQKLWHQFFVEQVASKIPNKVSNSLVALYYDYESDKHGYYTILIGIPVSEITEIPAGLVAQHVQAENRAVFESTQGSVSTIVFDLWQKIWALEDQGSLDRAYTIDYELYDERSGNREDALMEIHIAVK